MRPISKKEGYIRDRLSKDVKTQEVLATYKIAPVTLTRLQTGHIK